MSVSTMTFQTAVGLCAIAWRDARVVGVQLPERSAVAMRRRLRIRFPSAAEREPPPEIAAAVAAMIELLHVGRAALDRVPLNLADVPAFDAGVYQSIRGIPAGQVRTYGAVAAEIGAPEAAREVGAALGRNPFPLVVPCHRVVAAGGKLGGFSAAGGTITKRRLLAIENARFKEGPDLFDRLSPIAS
jgi:methylated-DNA-[protein]-cysteine S-methyltransferase